MAYILPPSREPSPGIWCWSCDRRVLAMFPPERGGALADGREVKQKITKKLSSSLRALQIRYVATDDVITSDDDDANGLCVALEAVFIHGLKAKYVKIAPERRRYKGHHVSLPQPAFWTLLKAVTHRNVIGQLESVSYISTDVGRCRAWLRLALNECVMESYFLSLRREKSRLLDYYQPSSLMLDAEDCDVVLTYLQGLSSLSFHLSYKSSILNEWTASPLLLAAVWQDEGERAASYERHRRKSLDSVSQSSGSDDTSNSMISESQRKPESSLSLDSGGSSSSRLSSSLGSDEHSQGSGAPNSSPAGNVSIGPPAACDRADSPILKPRCAGSPPRTCAEMAQEGTVTDVMDPRLSVSEGSRNVAESPSSAARRLPESSAAHRLPESSAAHRLPESSAAQCLPESSAAQCLPESSAAQCLPESSAAHRLPESSAAHRLPESSAAHRLPESSAAHRLPESSAAHRLPESSAAELPKSRSWISEEDFTRVDPVFSVEEAQSGDLYSQSLDPVQPDGQNPPGKTFNVVHRRQIGLSNPFRGLLMLGSLERKNALGLYKPYYCELTPYEFRLQPEGDDQSCAETCSLLRCDLLGAAQGDGRFELQFPNKRLYLRAACEDEAQDWVDRITEAVRKFRPHTEDSWEILQFPDSPQNCHGRNGGSPCRSLASPDGSLLLSEARDWSSPLEVELDALKESVLYMKIHKKWTRFVFSLSARALKCFLLRDREKSLYSVHGIATVRDILPDSSLGGPSCFRLVTTKGSFQLQAESAEEAKAWRELVRAACLESEDLTFLPTSGNFQIKSSIREHLLFPYLLRIPSERGLDTQNFKCAGCHKQIGLQFGKAKLCAYSGLYYCGLCHQDERSIIPSRMIHNWDLTERAVSHQAINFFKIVQKEPLFNLKFLNESLYQHTRRMRAIGANREKLRLLGEYLMSCRSGALQEVSASLDGRCYLLECAHTYSVQDLKQVSDGVFACVLQSAVDRASSHVFQCDLCSQRGFICQVCNADDIIYPFQFETTTRCGDCKAVFHLPCKAGVSHCLRCVRRRQYRDRGRDPQH